MACQYSDYWDGYSRCKLKASEDHYISNSHYNEYCKYTYEYEKCPYYVNSQKGSGSNSSGCFLTSACVEAMGLPDDCYELETLRKYRDGWLKQQVYGKESVDEYYDVAPKVVNKIDSLENSKEIYENLYQELVLPCVALIEAEKYEMAFEKYKNTVNQLKAQYLDSSDLI